MGIIWFCTLMVILIALPVAFTLLLVARIKRYNRPAYRLLGDLG